MPCDCVERLFDSYPTDRFSKTIREINRDAEPEVIEIDPVELHIEEFHVDYSRESS